MRLSILAAALLLVSVQAGAGRPPLECNVAALDDAQRARQVELLTSVRAKVVEKRELRDGWAFRLPSDAATFRDAAEWISLERRCCPFLSYELSWSDGDQAWVSLRGRSPAKAFIEAEMQASDIAR